MANILNNIISGISNLRMMATGGEQSHDGVDHKEEAPVAGPYHPTPMDICLTREMLSNALGFPPDVVDMIFDHAEYWAHSSNTTDFLSEHQDYLRILGNSSTENRFLLRSIPVGLTGIYGLNSLAEELAYDTNEAKPAPLDKEHDASYFKSLADYPTPPLVSPVRKVVFSIRSRDQGWGGEPGTRGTFNAAWSWFEAGLERFDETQTCDPHCNYDVRYESPKSKASPLPVCGLRPLRPPIEQSILDEAKYHYVHEMGPDREWTIQRNRVATKAWQDHVVTWSHLDHTPPGSEEAAELDEKAGRGGGTADGSFVRGLKMGDVITVWGKARFGGWANHVERVTVDVYWAV